MSAVDTVLAAGKGLVVAPAGCGKTQLIVDSLRIPVRSPTLVLTHTTAGVAALRHRLVDKEVPSEHYRLSTIAGWALNIIGMFPERCGYVHNPLDDPDFPQVQNAVAELCSSGHIDKLLAATYSRLLVDEYQDCSISQHLITEALARSLSTVVFGDPLQAIFGFGEPVPNWENTVNASFPQIATLDIPWRWKKVGADKLGTWLLSVRTALLNYRQIDLRTCNSHVTWHQLSGNHGQDLKAQLKAQYQILRNHPHEKLLIIGDSIHADSRHRYASRSQGVSVVEPVELEEIVTASRVMNGQKGMPLLETVLAFLSRVMTNVKSSHMLKRVHSISNGRNRTAPTVQEAAALELSIGGGYSEAITLMNSMNADRDRRMYRKSAFNVMIEALRQSAFLDEPLDEIVARLREQRRHACRTIPYKAIGSTLLFKGLEAEHVLILDADSPRNPMSREHLYVALSRGSKSVTIFSRSPHLPA